MTEELPTEDKLRKDIDITSWSELEVHQKRSALIMIDHSLDLATVALKIASDDTESIKTWMSQNLIDKPTESQIEAFKENPMHKQFDFLIVQPYVLIQTKMDA